MKPYFIFRVLKARRDTYWGKSKYQSSCCILVQHCQILSLTDWTVGCILGIIRQSFNVVFLVNVLFQIRLMHVFSSKITEAAVIHAQNNLHNLFYQRLIESINFESNGANSCSKWYLLNLFFSEFFESLKHKIWTHFLVLTSSKKIPCVVIFLFNPCI